MVFVAAPTSRRPKMQTLNPETAVFEAFPNPPPAHTFFSRRSLSAMQFCHRHVESRGRRISAKVSSHWPLLDDGNVMVCYGRGGVTSGWFKICVIKLHPVQPIRCHRLCTDLHHPNTNPKPGQISNFRAECGSRTFCTAVRLCTRIEARFNEKAVYGELR
jgi:hypothetical protein